MRPAATFVLQPHDLMIICDSNKMKCKRIVEVTCYSIMLVCTAISNTNHIVEPMVASPSDAYSVEFHSQKRRKYALNHCKLSNATIHAGVAATWLTGSCPHLLHAVNKANVTVGIVWLFAGPAMLPMKLLWAPRLMHHGVWAGYSFSTDASCDWEFSGNGF